MHKRTTLTMNNYIMIIRTSLPELCSSDVWKSPFWFEETFFSMSAIKYWDAAVLKYPMKFGKNC